MTHAHPWQTAVRAIMARSAGAHQIEEIQYGENGMFIRVLRNLGAAAAPEHAVVLDAPALDRLLADLTAELDRQPIGVDAVGLTVFVHLVRARLGLSGLADSRLFEAARFGAVSRDHSRMLHGHVELGADVAGTVADDDHTLSFEQHLAAWPFGGDYRLLSAAEQASLCRALTRALRASPPADPAWRSILEDAEAESGRHRMDLE